MKIRRTGGLSASHWIAAGLALAVAGCGGESSADGRSTQAAGAAPSQAVDMTTASDLSDAEILVYKSPT